MNRLIVYIIVYYRIVLVRLRLLYDCFHWYLKFRFDIIAIHHAASTKLNSRNTKQHNLYHAYAYFIEKKALFLYSRCFLSSCKQSLQLYHYHHQLSDMQYHINQQHNQGHRLPCEILKAISSSLASVNSFEGHRVYYTALICGLSGEELRCQHLYTAYKVYNVGLCRPTARPYLQLYLL